MTKKMTFDIDQELASMMPGRLGPKPTAPQPEPPIVEAPPQPQPEPPQETPPPTVETPPIKAKLEPKVDYQAFIPLQGVFEQVGGDRPVQLAQTIGRSQVSNIPEPMIVAVQDQLTERFTGATVVFPWGVYTINNRHRVFTTKSSCMRYLLFDSLRDDAGTHVQYAKQWLVLQHPNAFDDTFDPTRHLTPSADELDIYVLLYVAHQRFLQSNGTGKAYTTENEAKMHDNMRYVRKEIEAMSKDMKLQQKMLQVIADRNTVTQTVLLLDRMGLLTGGIPKDVGEFVRILELNRDTLYGVNHKIDEHIVGEYERQETLDKDARMKRKPPYK